jgi:hypothetical protein
MIRRLISILLVCAGLLGLTQPLMACVVEMPSGHCCPPDPASGCTHGSAIADFAVAGNACCLTTTMTSCVASVARSVDDPLHANASPAPLLLPPFRDDNPNRVATFSDARAAHASHRADARLTYLYTARLRL